MKYCTKCGAQLNDEAKFCPKCGASTGSGAVKAPQQDPLPLQQDVVVSEQSLQQDSPATGATAPGTEQKKNKKSSLPLILGIIAAIAILAVAGVFIYKKFFDKGITGTWEDAYGMTTFTFNKDGSCSMGAFGMDVDGTYTVKDGVITMTLQDYLVEQFSYEINEKDHDQMTLYDPTTGEGMVYRRMVPASGGKEAVAEAEPETVQAQTVPETVVQTVSETTVQTAAEAEATTKAEAQTESVEEDPFEGEYWRDAGSTELSISQRYEGMYYIDEYSHAAGVSQRTVIATRVGDELLAEDRKYVFGTPKENDTYFFKVLDNGEKVYLIEIRYDQYTLYCSVFDAGTVIQDGTTVLVNVVYDDNSFSCDYLASYGNSHIQSTHSYGLNTNRLSETYKSDAYVYSYPTEIGDAYVDVFEKEGIIRITPPGEDGVKYFTNGANIELLERLVSEWGGTVSYSSSEDEQPAMEASVADCFLKYGTETEKYNLTVDALFAGESSAIDRGDRFEVTNCRLDVYDNIPESVFEGKRPGDEITWRGVTYRILDDSNDWIDMEKSGGYSDPYYAYKTEYGYRIGSIDEWVLTRTVYEGSVFFDKSCIIEGYRDENFTGAEEYFVSGLGDSKWERGFEYGMSEYGFRTYGYIREIGQDGRVTHFQERFSQ